MKSNLNSKIGLLFYLPTTTAKYFELSRKKCFLFFIVPSLLSFIFLFILVAQHIYYNRFGSLQVFKTAGITAEIAKSSFNDISLEVSDLKNENNELKNRLALAPSGIAIPTLYLFKGQLGQKDLSLKPSLSIELVSLSSVGDKISFKFNIVNQTQDNARLSGHIFVIHSQDDFLQIYPSNTTDESLQINYTKGESFLTSRFRPSEATFQMLHKEIKGHFKIIIFSRMGDIIFKQIYPVSSIPQK